MSKEPWICRLVGRTHTQDGKLHRVERLFDGGGDVEGKARACLAQRRDRGAPWYGDAVHVITPLGQCVTVEIPWPEVGS